MTLTELIRAHDGGDILAEPLSVYLSSQIAFATAEERTAQVYFWKDARLALQGDLNAAWRLLPEGWYWGSYHAPEIRGGKRTVYACTTTTSPAVIPHTVLYDQHKSLPCAMVLAALQAWGIE